MKTSLTVAYLDKMRGFSIGKHINEGDEIEKSAWPELKASSSQPALLKECVEQCESIIL